MSEKTKAGVVLSRYLKEIGNEPSLDGKTTKAELLARTIWDLALGGVPSGISATGVVISSMPDRTMIAMIFDRLEGKIGSWEENVKRIENIPDKIGKIAVAHINKMSVEKVA